MTLHVNVQGGTNAGRRKVKPTPATWQCNCLKVWWLCDCDDPCDERCLEHLKVQPSHLAACPDCGARRPE